MTDGITIIPPGTLFSHPNPIHQITLQFPDEDSAILFFEWVRGLTHAVSLKDSESKSEG